MNGKEPGCPFCNLDRPSIVESDLVVAFSDAFPATVGHALVVPRWHRPTYFDCTEEERTEIWRVVDSVRRVLAVAHDPDGFNVGFNVGSSAGQTVFHAHVHVIPRYAGDVPDPRGGVRHAVIGRGYPHD